MILVRQAITNLVSPMDHMNLTKAPATSVSRPSRIPAHWPLASPRQIEAPIHSSSAHRLRAQPSFPVGINHPQMLAERRNGEVFRRMSAGQPLTALHLPHPCPWVSSLPRFRPNIHSPTSPPRDLYLHPPIHPSRKANVRIKTSSLTLRRSSRLE